MSRKIHPRKIKVIIADDDGTELGGFEYDLAKIERIVKQAQKKGTSRVQIAHGLAFIGDEVGDRVGEEVRKALVQREEARR
jgi:DhnA family fructose-bisphosphate aldolase class Ia